MHYLRRDTHVHESGASPVERLLLQMRLLVDGAGDHGGCPGLLPHSEGNDARGRGFASWESRLAGEQHHALRFLANLR